VPSTFIRLATCNLRCSWCDTRYSWDWSEHDPKQEIASLEVDEAVERLRREAATNVVITGGEPLLQQVPLAELAARLKLVGKRIEIETNGTIMPSAELAGSVDQWNVSPKLENSKNPLGLRENEAALAWFSGQQNAFMKFVVEQVADVDEALNLAMKVRMPSDRLVLMPEGTSAAAIQKRSQWLVEECTRRGVRYSTRIHILLWGAERGR
jgi:7-carboxy-7-deazaguanine synthase